MSKNDRQRWNRKYEEQDYVPEAHPLLRRHAGLLSGGRALDVACGVGQNSIWLAQHNYHVLGVDISETALREARARAQAAGVAERTEFVQADLDRWRPAAESFDLVIVFRFLDRGLLQGLKKSVKERGLLIYHTRHTGFLHRFPDATRAYLLERGELPTFFSGWPVLLYEEGDENASIIVEKPPEGDERT